MSEDTDMQECTCHECGTKFNVPVIVYCPNGHRAFWDYDSWRRASAAKERRISALESKPDHSEAVRKLRAIVSDRLAELSWVRKCGKTFCPLCESKRKLTDALEQTKEFAE